MFFNEGHLEKLRQRSFDEAEVIRRVGVQEALARAAFCYLGIVEY